MKKTFATIMIIVLRIAGAHAQADHKLDSATLALDKSIMKEFIKPMLQEAREKNVEPEWLVVGVQIGNKYGIDAIGRNIVKAKLFYWYGKDWAQFSISLAYYTDHYEWKDSLSLMNMNAQMILQHSQSQADWKAAQRWVKYATDKNPSNEDYRKTYDALTAKLNGN
jgi:hypothetical protein